MWSLTHRPCRGRSTLDDKTSIRLWRPRHPCPSHRYSRGCEECGPIFEVSPVGNRGFESLLAVEKFVEQHPHGGEVIEITGMEYLQQANDSLVIAVQIETKAALENVREIAAVPSVDVLFIGPFDLSVNIGHPITNPEKMDPELVKAIQSIHDAARAAGKASGIYCDTGEQAREYSNKGFQMMSVMTDMVGMRKVFKQAFDAAKGDL